MLELCQLLIRHIVEQLRPQTAKLTGNVIAT